MASPLFQNTHVTKASIIFSSKILKKININLSSLEVPHPGCRQTFPCSNPISRQSYSYPIRDYVPRDNIASVSVFIRLPLQYPKATGANFVHKNTLGILI